MTIRVRFARTSVKSSWSLRRRCWAKLCDCIEKFRATAKIRAIEADKVSDLKMGIPFYQLCLCGFILQTGVYAANNAPTFINDMNGFALREDTPVGTKVYTLTGRDDDGDHLVYGIVADMFTVRDPSSGEVYLTKKLDYESLVQPFKVKIWVKDEELTVEREPAITVIDVNDELPQFDRTTYHTSIRETAVIGTTVWTNLEVTDADRSNPQLRVTCVPPSGAGSVNPCDVFVFSSVNPCDVFGLRQREGSNMKWRGDLILNGRLNYDQHRTYNVYIRAYDGVHNITQKIQVDIVDVQDKPPRFTNAPRATISENVGQGTPVLQIKAVDGDISSSRQIVYELVSNPGNLFRIDRYTGQISTNREIDRESPLLLSSIVPLIVKASEVVSGSTVGTDLTSFSVMQVNITIQDQNDNAPEFNQDNYQVTIPEDMLDRTPLSTPIIEVTDRDQGDNAAFELILANHNDMFGVQPTEGSESLTAHIYVKNASLIDFDTEPRKYVLHLIARETKTTEKKSNHAYVTIDLTDVNDNKPVFAQPSYTASVSETATGDTPVIRITATDIDSGIFGNAGLYYKLIGNGADKFRVNMLTGQVTVADCLRPGSGNCLDYEQQREYKLTFVVGDQFGEGFIVNVPLTIHVIDENDNSPKLGLPSYFRYIKEGETIPSPALKVQATDADSPRNGNNVITYSIVGGNVGDLWQIGSRSGVITARSPVDYEATPGNRGYYLLTVQVADPQHKVTAQVNISVIDVNDHPPVFTQNGRYEETISEETPPRTVVETVRATDADAASSLNSQVKYRITTGAQDKFALNATTGVMTVAPDATFDYDVQNLYEMIVLATDQGSPQKTATATVLVHIRDVNNKNPYFLPTTVTTNIYESE
ncbi:Cadherin-87A [Lamellibrachia satsuma]|nr:Cadherin-87A [Lamellibrachia satsuma]